MDPLSKEHIVLNCVARQVTTKIIEIDNPYKDRDVTYRVETDLINPEGPPKFTIKAGKKHSYPLVITPLLGGVYTGQITFIEEDDDSKYIWYTICINTQRPRMEKIIELSAVVRKAVAFDISLRNPLKEPTSFEVSIEGEFLMGAPIFTLPPLQTATYELLFTPLRTGKSKGSIAFINDRLGEIWYELHLVGGETPVTRLPTLKSELGKSERHQIALENPSN